MLNKLFITRFIREVYLKNGKVLKYSGGWSYLQYGEQQEETKEITEWSELLKVLNYEPEFQGNTDRKGRIWCHLVYYDKNYNWKQVRLFKEEFEKAVTHLEVKVKEPKNIRMKELVNELNAEEFILFLKDNEINYVGGL